MEKYPQDNEMKSLCNFYFGLVKRPSLFSISRTVLPIVMAKTDKALLSKINVIIRLVLSFKPDLKNLVEPPKSGMPSSVELGPILGL